MLHVAAPKSDPNREIYFWAHNIDGRTITFSSHETNLTPHWCDFHEWGSSEPCDICRKGELLF